MGDLIGDNRPPTYWENIGGEEVLIVRCSALGGCLWELIAAAQGMEPAEPPESLKKAFQRGHELEPVILNRLKSEYDFVLMSGQAERHLRIDTKGGIKVLVRYHPDSIGIWQDNEWVVEAKALGKQLYRKAELHGVESTIAEYAWQLSIMMHAENKPAVWAVLNKEDDSFLLQVVDKPFIMEEEIIAKVNMLVDNLDADLLERPCDDPKHFPCRYLAVRPEPEDLVETLILDDISPESVDEFDRAAREYLYTKGQIDELEKRKKDAQTKLKQLASNFHKVRTDRYKVTMVDSHNTSADRRKMIEDGVWDKYQKRTDYSYPLVKGLE